MKIIPGGQVDIGFGRLDGLCRMKIRGVFSSVLTACESSWSTIDWAGNISLLRIARQILHSILADDLSPLSTCGSIYQMLKTTTY